MNLNEFIVKYPNVDVNDLMSTAFTVVNAIEEAREEINEIFKATIRKATNDAKIALANAATAEQKMVVMNTLKKARISAVLLRDAALAALGPLPTPPMERRKELKP